MVHEVNNGCILFSDVSQTAAEWLRATEAPNRL